MSQFDRAELLVIADALNAIIPSKQNLTDAELVKHIKEAIDMRQEHLADVLHWLSEQSTYANVKGARLNRLADAVINYVYDNYPKFDDYTMYELIKLLEDKIIPFLAVV